MLRTYMDWSLNMIQSFFWEKGRNDLARLRGLDRRLEDFTLGSPWFLVPGFQIGEVFIFFCQKLTDKWCQLILAKGWLQSDLISFRNWVCVNSDAKDIYISIIFVKGKSREDAPNISRNWKLIKTYHPRFDEDQISIPVIRPGTGCFPSLLSVPRPSLNLAVKFWGEVWKR